MLAKSRTAMLSGWAMNFVTSSIGVSRTYIALGTPGMNMMFLRYVDRALLDDADDVVDRRTRAAP